MSNALSSFTNNRFTKSEPANIVESRGGNPAHLIDDKVHLRRFLIIGTDGSQFYIDSSTVALESTGTLARMLNAGRGMEVLDEVENVSRNRLAVKADTCILALALAMSYGVGSRQHSVKPINDIIQGNGDTEYAKLIRVRASEMVSFVAGTPTHLFMCLNFVRKFRGMGTLVKNAIDGWFKARNNESLAYQAVKYRQRNGWTLRDVLRISHMKTSSCDVARTALIDWITHRSNVSAHLVREEIVGGKLIKVTHDNRIASDKEETPAKKMNADTMDIVNTNFPVIASYYKATEASDVASVIEAIERGGLPWECVPDKWLRAPAVWDSILSHIKPDALLRNLGRLGSIEYFNEHVRADFVSRMLTDVDYIQKSKVHPFAIYLARYRYAQGCGLKGSLVWSVNEDILSALDKAFEIAFGNVKPTGKLMLLGVDVSGSMWNNHFSGCGVGGTDMTAGEAAIALAMITAKTEAKAGKTPLALGFTAERYNRGFRRIAVDKSADDGLTKIHLDENSTLSQLKRDIRELSRIWGSTDATLIIRYAIENNLAVDTFVIYTDNENNSSPEMVTQSLEEYRKKTGIQARLVSIAFTATNYSVADASDPLQMDIVGFDASAPTVLSGFINGEI